MTQTQRALAALLLCALVLGSQPATAEPWPNKKFRIVQVKARMVDMTLDLPGVGTTPEIPVPSLPGTSAWRQGTFNYLSEEQVQYIEAWMNKVANDLEAQRFPKPRYEATSSDGSFEVYVYPGAGFGTLDDCDDPDGTVAIHIDPYSATALKDGELTERGHHDLAHEIFHAVQAGYSGKCAWGRWVVEGTAEAVATDIMRRLRNQKPSHCTHGLRRYSRELYSNDKTAFGDYPCKQNRGSLDYHSASFWQFLGEHEASNWTAKKYTPSEEFTQPRYRYLQTVFDMPYGPAHSKANDYEWLNRGLNKSLTISLSRAYSRFAGAFSTYWRPRRFDTFKSELNGSSYPSEKNWMEWAYGECATTTVSNDVNGTAVVEGLPIEPMASRCIKMSFSGFAEKALVKLEVLAEGVAASIDVDALTLSINGGERTIRRGPTETSGKRIGKLQLELDANPKPIYIIVSNADRSNPSVSAAWEPKITFIHETIVADGTKKIKKEGKRTSLEEATDNWGSRSWSGRLRQKSRSPCIIKPFDASPCGEITEIVLHYSSDTQKMLEEAVDPGTSLDRSMRTAEGIASAGDAALIGNIAKSVRETQSVDGWRVKIQIPQIQPGHEGSVSQAHVSSKKAYREGQERENQHAIGAWKGDCRDGYHPANGQIIVREFSEDVFIGSLTANLVEEAEHCGGVTVVRPVNTPFVITDIDLGDEVSTPMTDEEQDELDAKIIDRKIEDVNELLPGLVSPEMAEHIRRTAQENRENQRNDQGSGSPGSSDSADSTTAAPFQCDCSCPMAMVTVGTYPQCFDQCENKFKQCPDYPTLVEVHEIRRAPTDQEHSDIEQLRLEYNTLVRQKFPDPKMRDKLLDTFDKLPGLANKKMLVDSLR